MQEKRSYIRAVYYLPKDQVDRLKQITEATRLPMSAVVSRALDEHLENAKSKYSPQVAATR